MVLSVFSYSQKGANYQLTDFHLSAKKKPWRMTKTGEVFSSIGEEEAGGKRRFERRLKRVGLGF